MSTAYDFVIIGSGFGGSVSALRLAEKGYRVLVLEKGRRLGPADFPRSNWQLKRWLWLPALGFRGLFKMTFMRHVTVVSGVGVGGGSLVYANTLPIPEDDFFAAPQWATLAPWKEELAPHYREARRMLGAVQNPNVTRPDEVLRDLARENGQPQTWMPSTVAVYFGEPGREVEDPYFGGAGPRRSGCTGCGACMLGCRYGAKNTLDKNYLYFAEKRGVTVEADSEAVWVRPRDGGYEVEVLSIEDGGRRRVQTANVVFAGGVLGTVELLLRLKASPDGLPDLSDRVGDFVRTNSETLIGVTSSRRDVDLSRGIAIGSIVATDAHSHLEPVRYPAGSGFFRLLMAPHVAGDTVGTRLLGLARSLARHPLRFLRALLVPDWAKFTMILLYMRSLEGHLRLRLGRFGLTTAVQDGARPRASIPEASALAERVAIKLDGAATSLANETLFDVPTTAHILGGACMGESAATGVIDARHRVFGYDGLFVVDGSAISANPGVNPSLTITALAERAMTFIPPK